jgi:hypothetical protein
MAFFVVTVHSKGSCWLPIDFLVEARQELKKRARFGKRALREQKRAMREQKKRLAPVSCR